MQCLRHKLRTTDLEEVLGGDYSWILLHTARKSTVWQPHDLTIHRSTYRMKSQVCSSTKPLLQAPSSIEQLKAQPPGKPFWFSISSLWLRTPRPPKVPDETKADLTHTASNIRPHQIQACFLGIEYHTGNYWPRQATLTYQATREDVSIEFSTD